MNYSNHRLTIASRAALGGSYANQSTLAVLAPPLGKNRANQNRDFAAGAYAVIFATSATHGYLEKKGK